MIDYKVEGCYKKKKGKNDTIFTKKFNTVKGVDRKDPDVEKIYLECKELAEKEGYEIFAIQVKVLVYTKYILKSECQWSVSFNLLTELSNLFLRASLFLGTSNIELKHLAAFSSAV